MIDYDLLKNYADKIGVELDSCALDRLDIYADNLVAWNQNVNLTAITEPDEIVVKHFIDSLMVLKYVPVEQNAKLIDVGTGAGFPGMPLFIARPDIEVTFLDCMHKRMAFLKDVLRNNGMMATRIHERAEVLGQNSEHREAYDYATARAVAPLNVLCEYCMPFVKVGGAFAALKGKESETDSAETAVKLLGGKIESVHKYLLPGGDERCLIVIRKISQTPTKYPRRSKKIDTKPL